MNKLFNKLRFWVLKRLTRGLLNAITEDDILQITSQGFLLNKRLLSPEEVSAIKEEAKLFGQSSLWRLMTREIGYLAKQSMFERAKTYDDLMFGKAMLYNLDLLRKFFERLKDL